MRRRLCRRLLQLTPIKVAPDAIWESRGMPHETSTTPDQGDARYVRGTGTSRWTPRLTLPVTPDRDHIRGPVDAPVTLLEYGDFECPYCGMAYPIVESVLAQMGDQVRFVFRHFPLIDMHPHAERAAEAAEAADAQGKFWDMHQMLFENQENLSDRFLLVYAQTLGLDLARFTDDLATGLYRPRVSEDFISGVNSGVNGTPSFFINDVKHEGPWDAASLLGALQSSATRMHA
ncbi:MAG: bdbD [Gammaproteobacteria bacterium]|nr:bdbD [Gammaproteobacteria bacterium]